MKTDRIAELLPDVVQRTVIDGSVTTDLLAAMEALHDPVETVLADFGAYVDPYRCPSRFVPLLAHWVGYSWLLPDDADRSARIAEGPLRHLIFNAAPLAKDRGTRSGLARTLDLATGTTGFTVGDDPIEPFQVEVRGPDEARPWTDLVQRIVGHEKPAFVTATIAFGQDEAVRLDRLLDTGSSALAPRPAP